MTSFSIVIPTTGRPSLGALFTSLAGCDGPLPEHVVVIDDRLAPHPPLSLEIDGWPGARLRVLDSDGRGPAAARNIGWRAVRSEWVTFLDDDVAVPPNWLGALADDLAAAAPDVAVSRAGHGAADMAYRRTALERVRGFDERFGSASRRDADLALRVAADGFRFVAGHRQTAAQASRTRRTASVVQLRGNGDDALMRALHGADWYQRTGASAGAKRRRAATVAAAGLAVVAASRRRRRTLSTAVTWAIPPAAVAHLVRGTLRYRGAPSWAAIAPPLQPPPAPTPVGAVLLDLGGTLLKGTPNEDRIEPLPGVARSLDRLRAAGIKIGVISNQDGISTGLLGTDEVRAVNGRIEELLGPFDTWQVCPHGERDRCRCRMPEPGLVHAAAADLDVPVERCAVIGDVEADVRAGLAAGAGVTILVPTPATRPEDVARAPLVFATLAEATDELIISRARGFAA